ncbi:HEAT repeat domain-containing protein [Maribellus maritimus]|uniref:HEAT repeat domain-containing protein n=1 Tax=Maribellus maritimus TaxID=2870838 RepID=UPI001EEB1E79|nr:hypothetical protein [Maribellus maritimus]MCG6186236.1 hypothetical protein [Maribellus maritimus]
MKLNLKNLFAGFLLIFLFTSCNEQKKGIAIVTDTKSYVNAQDEIDAYVNVLKNEGLVPTLLIKDYSSPDTLRKELIKLYQSSTPIEGAVFIGDIPIVMSVDAQHMTSAFKMDQKKYGMYEACVATDRFYDDFDLVFDYIEQDSANALKYYYSLNYQSAQSISPDIYSGRIKMPEGKNKYELLKKYLKKVVAQHSAENKVDEFFFFSGHGYISESLVARLDEQTALYEQLPGNPAVSYLDHTMKPIMKFPYMAELQREDLDIGLLHHHGGEETEYLSGDVLVDTYRAQLKQLKKHLRDEVYYEQKYGDNDIKGLKAYFKEHDGIPGTWFDGAFDPETIKEDSIFSADMNLTVDDFPIYNYNPNVRFAIFDACYNGSFNKDKYLAGAYIFGDGKTVAAQGNSINVIQDKWSSEMLGLLSLGLRVGEWNKQVCFLETHLIGDPTFRFTSIDPSLDVQDLLDNQAENVQLWKRMLSSQYPDVQCLALRMLYENEYEDISQLLLDTYKTSGSFNVRTEAFMLSSKLNDENFMRLLKLALFDDYEFIQRFAVKFAGNSGSDELIPDMIKLAFINFPSRVEFNYQNAILFFDNEKLLAEFDRQAGDISFLVKHDEAIPHIREFFEASGRRFNSVKETLTSKESSERKTYNTIRNLRNYNYHQGVDTFLSFIENSDNLEHKVMMVEALGWFTHSVKAEKIIDFCKKLAADENEPDVLRQEAEKTVLRLS